MTQCFPPPCLPWWLAVGLPLGGSVAIVAVIMIGMTAVVIIDVLEKRRRGRKP